MENYEQSNWSVVSKDKEKKTTTYESVLKFADEEKQHRLRLELGDEIAFGSEAFKTVSDGALQRAIAYKQRRENAKNAIPRQPAGNADMVQRQRPTSEQFSNGRATY